jgi:hypothetical protein
MLHWLVASGTEARLPDMRDIFKLPAMHTRSL